MDYTELKGIIEELLFIWGEPLEIKEISKVLEIPLKEVKDLLEQMESEFKMQKRGLVLKRLGDCYQLQTKEEHFSYISKLIPEKKDRILSDSAMETLAIIAYKQPVTKIEVDLIRGVKSQSSVDTLLNRGYIEEKGRLDKIGRPILYGTTNKFLRAFNISDLTELPKFQEFSMKEMTDINEIE